MMQNFLLVKCLYMVQIYFLKEWLVKCHIIIMMQNFLLVKCLYMVQIYFFEGMVG